MELLLNSQLHTDPDLKHLWRTVDLKTKVRKILNRGTLNGSSTVTTKPLHRTQLHTPHKRQNPLLLKSEKCCE
jgi:hypothetical protein